MPRKYTPRRASKRWLEGAPDYILDVLDDKKSGDRYTVLLHSDQITYHLQADRTPKTGSGRLDNTFIQYLGLSEYPSHPMGVSTWGEMEAYQAAAFRYRCKHHRIRWMDLPENVRKHVIARAATN